MTARVTETPGRPGGGRHGGPEAPRPRPRGGVPRTVIGPAREAVAARPRAPAGAAPPRAAAVRAVTPPARARTFRVQGPRADRTVGPAWPHRHGYRPGPRRSDGDGPGPPGPLGPTRGPGPRASVPAPRGRSSTV
eukprot:8142-Hanusia_phi.AAC.1